MIGLGVNLRENCEGVREKYEEKQNKKFFALLCKEIAKGGVGGEGDKET